MNHAESSKKLNMKFSAVLLLVVVGYSIWQGMAPQPIDEEALLTDWSKPPPFIVFNAINHVAGVLRSMANALTPPPVRMFDISFIFQQTVLAYTLYKFNVPEFLAEPRANNSTSSSTSKTIEEIAAHM